MTNPDDRPLLASAVEVPFPEIESALARIGQPARAKTGPRALTATVVVVGPLARLFDAADALEELSDGAGIRTILISNGGDDTPSVRLSGHAVAIQGLRPEFVNNAVAALRLSSLPTLVWWRGGEAESLEQVAALADRLVLDAEDPRPSWARAEALFERTAVSDLRWTRLTRWRALLAHFMDVPEVRAAAPSFRTLRLRGADRDALRLFAGWLMSALDWKGDLALEVQAGSRAPLDRVRWFEGAEELLLALGPSGRCVETAAHVRGHSGATRIVGLGEQGLSALIAEELRIRSRDAAFERALASAEGVA